MEDLLPELEKEGIRLVLEPHPDDFEEDGKRAVDLVRAVDSPNVSFLYCTPHTFHQGNDVDGILDRAGPLTTMCHLADAYDHTASSGCGTSSTRPGRRSPSTSTRHRSGRGRLRRFFAALERTGFDGILTACVFALGGPRRGVQPVHARDDRRYLSRWATPPALESPR